MHELSSREIELRCQNQIAEYSRDHPHTYERLYATLEREREYQKDVIREAQEFYESMS